LIRDERLLDAVESLIGPNLGIVVCQGMYKPPYSGDEIRWHQDDYYFQVDKPNAVVSCWLTLDDATAKPSQSCFDHKANFKDGS
jgi:ectoine hydroxylase-related dioxygenase (phytanoyl-CoA dioxygenase family)